MSTATVSKSATKKYTTTNAIIDVVMFFLTGGLWLIWMAVRTLKRMN